MRVLLATDGSESSAIAAELVGNIRWPLGTLIEVVRVVEAQSLEPAAGPWLALAPLPPVDQVGVIQEAEDALASLVEPLRKLGLTTVHAVLRGRPADAILERIEDHRPDIVIVGNRGLSTLERIVLGSVSAELVDGSPVPVLVARKSTLERVVVAVDGSDIASEAIATVRRWPFLAATEIRTLSVAPSPSSGRARANVAPPIYVAADDAAAAKDLLTEYAVIAADAATSLRDVGFEAGSEVLTGSPASAVVAFAEAWDADLVIMGSHGRTGLTRLLLGSVARNVLHHAACSVLVVRRHADPVRVRQMDAVARPWTILAAH